jgi:cardiolipin synthase
MTATRFRLYTEGDPFYDALAHAVAGARHHVHMEYYIFKDDAAARPLIALLAERVAAGVEVRIIADALGSRLPPEFVANVRAKGIQFAFFNPTMIARLGRRIINFRTHRKITVVDGVVGFIGGTNIWADHSVRLAGEHARRDTDIEIHGEAVQGLQQAFLEDWLFASDESFSGEALARYFPPVPAGPQIMQIIPSGPDTDEHPIYAFTLAAIGLARKRVWLTTPYFVPDEALLGALCIAARRGIDVQLIVPGKSDWRWVDAAGYSNHDELMRAGVKIFLNGPPLLHAKTAVIDDEIGVVSTANLDERSLKLNFEIAAVLYGGPGIEALATIFAGNRAASFRKEFLEADGPLGRRLFQAVARLLSPQL